MKLSLWMIAKFNAHTDASKILNYNCMKCTDSTCTVQLYNYQQNINYTIEGLQCREDMLMWPLSKTSGVARRGSCPRAPPEGGGGEPKSCQRILKNIYKCGDILKI